jgi:hypothetical protein
MGDERSIIMIENPDDPDNITEEKISEMLKERENRKKRDKNYMSILYDYAR